MDMLPVKVLPLITGGDFLFRKDNEFFNVSHVYVHGSWLFLPKLWYWTLKIPDLNPIEILWILFG